MWEWLEVIRYKTVVSEDWREKWVAERRESDIYDERKTEILLRQWWGSDLSFLHPYHTTIILYEPLSLTSLILKLICNKCWCWRNPLSLSLSLSDDQISDFWSACPFISYVFVTTLSLCLSPLSIYLCIIIYFLSAAM